MTDVFAIVAVCVVYVLALIYLRIGLRIWRREPWAEPRRRHPERRGWPELIRQVAATYVGGWLLLMVVIIFYYGGVARRRPDFALHAATGTLSLMGITFPLFLAVYWLATRPAVQRLAATMPGAARYRSLRERRASPDGRQHDAEGDHPRD
ncbi:DUF6256 family protein [Streptomyces hainanensis]|uniref:Uncharacterized protein n=1 Tax=Streptomyces hainanensis TaxID=402648 RepID=A0A4R4TFH5_9ACTN|nr:DUF6256 family protein [Streptomyces hainanensis]TDC73673.1 hypothetical protein E1283_18485 [Streptomyces hainanensis]